MEGVCVCVSVCVSVCVCVGMCVKKLKGLFEVQKWSQWRLQGEEGSGASHMNHPGTCLQPLLPAILWVGNQELVRRSQKAQTVLYQ